MSDIQNLSIDDLIPGRDIGTIKIHDADKRSFLVSGAGGSIGSEIVRQILNNDPRKIILLDISEFNLYKIFEEAKLIIKQHNYSCEVIPYLGDVKDSSHMARIFNSHNIDMVYHAAAYKQVPLFRKSIILQSPHKIILSALSILQMKL